MTQKEYDEIRASVELAIEAERSEFGSIMPQAKQRILATLDDAVGNTLLDGTDPTVVVIGSPIDGITLYGPFDDHEEALDWGGEQICESWWAVDITHPDDED